MKPTKLHGYIEAGETAGDAIARIAVLAGQNGFDYELRCRECDTAFREYFRCECNRPGGIPDAKEEQIKSCQLENH